jgi:hypothetical protein
MMHMLAKAAHCNECVALVFYTGQPMRRQGTDKGEAHILVVDDEPGHVWAMQCSWRGTGRRQ